MSKTIFYAFFGFLSIFSIKSSEARETEQFQLRTDFVDVTDNFNFRFNQVLQEITDENMRCTTPTKESYPTAEERSGLFASLLNKMGGPGVALLEHWVSESPESKKVDFSDSLYVGWTYPKLMLFAFLGKIYPLLEPCCAPIVKLNQQLVAADKLGHFVSEGYELYYVLDLKKKGYPDLRDFVARLIYDKIDRYKATQPGVRGVIQLSQQMENNNYGLKVTGVYSYADTVANYEGYSFWRELVEGPSPYFKCREGRWKQDRKFDWSRYINAGWDEAINCNTYSPSMLRQVEWNISQKIISGSRVNFRCPVTPESCKGLRARYGELAKDLLHPNCFHASGQKTIE